MKIITNKDIWQGRNNDKGGTRFTIFENNGQEKGVGKGCGGGYPWGGGNGEKISDYIDDQSVFLD